MVLRGRRLDALPQWSNRDPITITVAGQQVFVGVIDRVRTDPQDASVVLDIHDRFVHGADPMVLCAGSSTRLGEEGYFELEIAGGQLRSATPRPL